MIEYKPKGLWQGQVAIPSEYLNNASQQNTGIRVEYKGREMIINDLKSFTDSREFPHKWKEGFYKLYYYPWKNGKG